MSRQFRRYAVVLLAALLVFGCAGEQARDSGPPEKIVDQAFVSNHKALAKALARQGKLTEALVHWRIVELLEPDNSAATKQRRALEGKIRSQAKRDLETARQAASSKNYRALRAALLRVLALDPLNDEARERLQAIEVASIRRNRPKVALKKDKKTPKVGEAYDAPAIEEPAKPKAVAGKAPAATAQTGLEDVTFQEAPLSEQAGDAVDGVELTAVAAAPDPAAEEARLGSLAPAIDLAKSGQHLDAIPQLQAHLDRFPKDEAARDLLADSHREIGIALYQDGKLRESVDHLKASERYAGSPDPELEAALSDARSRLAQQAYEQGVRAFNSDLKQAIALWEESLRYDPAHIRARSYLDKAYKIRETLSEISTTQ